MILLLLACTQPTPKDGAEDSAPYLVDESALDLPEPTFDADAASEAVAEAVVAFREITAEPIVDAWTELMAGEDAGCPTYYATDEGTYWYDDCVSDDGTHFQGYGALVRYTGAEDGGYAWSGDVVYAVATIEDPDGRVLRVNGVAGDLRGEGGGVSAGWNVVNGTFSWDGADEGWLSSELEPRIEMQALSAGSARAMRLDGSLGGLGTATDTVVLDEILLATEETGAPCSEEPTGTLSLRGADGHWTDVVFDVPFDAATETFGEMDEADCDGCGTAWFQGRDVGQACFDFSELLDWADSPW